MADINPDVQELADAYAEIEDGADRAAVLAAKMEQHYRSLGTNGVIGTLEADARSSAIIALTAQFRADLYALHRGDTLRAQELGVDVPPRARGNARSGGR